MGGRREGANRGGGWGGRRKNPSGEDTGRMVLTTQLDRRDTIPVVGRIPGWLVGFRRDGHKCIQKLESVRTSDLNNNRYIVLHM